MYLGRYVIYSNKAIIGKPHNTSWHAWLGLSCLGMYAIMGGMGALALDPDLGQLKTNKTIRLFHKLCGRVATVLGWVACLVGWYNLKGLNSTITLGIMVAAASWYLLK